MNQEITTGSVFDAIEADPGKAEQMKLKAALFDCIYHVPASNTAVGHIIWKTNNQEPGSSR